MGAIIALALLGLVVTTYAPIDTKAPQEIKSAQTSVEVVQPVKPKQKKVVKKVASTDQAKQQPTKELVKKETVKSEPTKPEATNISSPEQKTKQSNLLYYILGFITLGVVSAYFYFRKKSQTTDTKIYTSDELKQSLQQDSDKFKYQPPEQKTIIEPQSQPSSSDQTSADPKPDDEGKKS